MAAAGVVLALANATAYSTALFDPVVLAIAVFVAWPPGGGRRRRRAADPAGCPAVLLIAGLLIGGGSYLTGISRPRWSGRRAAIASLIVLLRAWSWTGIVIVLALCAVFSSWCHRQTGAAPGCLRCWPLPRCSGRRSRPSCTPPIR